MLQRVLRAITGAEKAEKAADALALRKLLRRQSKLEGPTGAPFIDLGDGLVLRQHDFLPIGPSRVEDTWRPFKVSGDDVAGRGDFKVSSDLAGDGATMDSAYLDSDVRGKGLGKLIYQKLADHYGTLYSSSGKTSKEARSVYKSLGAKQGDKHNVFGERRFELEARRPQQARWGIFGED